MVDKRLINEANVKYSEYLVSTGRRDYPFQRQAFLSGYFVGLVEGFNFNDFVSSLKDKKFKKIRKKI